MLLGIDIGTSGCKALLLDARGTVLASATEEYPFSTPRPQWSEQDPEEWWQGVCRALRRLLAAYDPHEIVGIGLTGQMHGLVLLDAHGAVLRPAILWNDQRTGAQCAEITHRAGGLPRLLELIANPVLPGFTAPKLLWVKENEPEVYSRATAFLLPKDYVRYRLTGVLATDVADASGTALFDVGRRCWSDAMAELVGVPKSWLPECTESVVVSGAVTAQAASLTGLAAGTPVVGGASDQAAQGVGSGVVSPGLVSVTSGTSGVVFAHAEHYAAEAQGRLHVFCHAVPDAWHVMGVMLSAGGALRWYRDTLGDVEKNEATLRGVDPYEILTEEAAMAPAGCEGMLFLPYLTGERTPHPDPLARAAFVGLTLRHTRSHLVRSVLEGVSFGLRDSLELIREMGAPIQQVRASGGGARSSVWRQIQADIFNTELVQVNAPEGAAFGAALLAGVGAGTYRSVPEAVAATLQVVGSTAPQPEAVATYARLYPAYRGLYHALKPTFDIL
jgi:xylulokinase